MPELHIVRHTSLKSSLKVALPLQPPPNKLSVSGLLEYWVVREGHPIPESTCWTSPIVIQPVEKRPFWSNGKKHVFLWKLAPAQGKDWAKGYPNLSPILPFSLPVILHLWQHAFLAYGEEFPGRKNKSSQNPLCGAPPNKSTFSSTTPHGPQRSGVTTYLFGFGNENFPPEKILDCHVLSHWTFFCRSFARSFGLTDLFNIQNQHWLWKTAGSMIDLFFANMFRLFFFSFFFPF